MSAKNNSHVSRTYVTAGVSRHPTLGYTFRFTNQDPETRKYTLDRNGHTSIKLIALPKAMSKKAAVAYLLSQNIGKSAKVPYDTKFA